MREWVAINGELKSADEARVSVFDSGFMQGIGLFETMRAYQGRVFRIGRHLDRLIRSARQLGWATLPEPEEMREAVSAVLGACEQAEARVRLTVTTGSLRAAVDSEEAPRLTIVASATDSRSGGYDSRLYEKGVIAAVSRYRQNPFDPTTGHKTTSYFSRLASLREAVAAGAIESIWFTLDQHLAEGAISNVFLVKNDVLYTPPVETPVLPGITRAAVLELAKVLRIDVSESPLTLDDVLGADEMFVTNSMMEVLPVIQLEKERIGDGKPGDVTAQLLNAYRATVAEESNDG
ncbi:MAG: aminotransferase class IV [Phycisphaerae bacterium]